RTALRSLAPSVPLYAPRPLTALVARDLARQRALVTLVGALAIVAIVLSALGVYGVVAYGVTQRRAESGLRMALGADAGSVARSVVWRGLTLGACGATTGVAAATVGGRALSRVLYGVGASDPLTLAAVLTAVLLVAIASAWIPAAR